MGEVEVDVVFRKYDGKLHRRALECAVAVHSLVEGLAEHLAGYGFER
jgi:hypothetical protein